MRRTIALGLLLFGIYAATIGLDAFGDSEYAGDEPHYLLAAQSIVDDHDIDVKNQYAARSYDLYYPYALDKHGKETNGFLHEPHGVGFPLLIAPAYAHRRGEGRRAVPGRPGRAADGADLPAGAEVVPDPWALGATLAVGVSPPFLAYATAVYPELTAALLLVGAALLAVEAGRAHLAPRRVRLLRAAGAAALAGHEVRARGDRDRPVRRTQPVPRPAADAGGGRRPRLAFFSVALYVGINESLYGGPTPYTADVAGETATDASFPLGYLERSYRLVALFIDRDYGLLRWAPLFLLAFVGVAMLYRSRRDQLSLAMPGLHSMQDTATMCAAALGAQLVVAGFLAPTMFGYWFPPRHMLAALALAVPLVAWGLRRLPRTGIALAVLTTASSVWLYLAVLLGSDGLVTPRPDAPFGPLTALFPRFGESAWPYALAAGIGAAVLALAFLEARNWRQSAGATRAKYSG